MVAPRLDLQRMRQPHKSAAIVPEGPTRQRLVPVLNLLHSGSVPADSQQEPPAREPGSVRPVPSARGCPITSDLLAHGGRPNR